MLKTQKTDWSQRFAERKLKAKKAAKESKVEATSLKIANTKPSHILREYT